MALRDVHYRVHAEVHPWPGFEDRIAAFDAQFRRRAKNGKCVWQPYLGCREFPAWFELAAPDTTDPPPTPLNQHLGFMLYDVFDLSKPGTSNSAPNISLFEAKIVDGVLEVPDYSSDEVLKTNREAV